MTAAVLFLEPAALAEDGQHRDQHAEHHDDDHPEGVDRVLSGQAGVHAPDGGDQREGEDHHRDGGQHPQHVVQAVRDQRLVGVFERLHDFLVVLEHVPDALGGVADVVEVDLELVADELLLRALQVGQHRALRADDLAEVDDLLLGVGDVAHDVLAAAQEDLFLQALQLAADLAQHREAVVEAVVDDLVEQEAGALAEQLLAEVLVRASALEQVLHRLERAVRQRDQVIRPEEDVELLGVQPADLLVEDRELENDEEVVVVLVDLRPLVARADVLVVERVELEMLLEPGLVYRGGALDVDPAEIVELDDLDPRLSGSLRYVRDPPSPGGAAQAWPWQVGHRV